MKSVTRLSSEGKKLYTHQYERYDLDGHLLSENTIYNSGRVEHIRDLNGHKTKISSPHFSQQALYDPSEKPEPCGCAQYDAHGNRTENGKTHYVYDPLNRLIEATFGKKKILFVYDPLGRLLTKKRMQKKSSGWSEIDQEHYLYNGEHEIGVLAQDGTLKNFRVLGLAEHPESPTTVAIELKNKVFVSLTDIQGNICRLIDPVSKTVAVRYRFSAYAEEEDLQKDENPWRYAGKRFDPELNLIYFGKKFYDPTSASWLTMDSAF